MKKNSNETKLSQRKIGIKRRKKNNHLKNKKIEEYKKEIELLKKQNERFKKRIQRKDNSKKEKNLIKKKDLKCLVEMRINIISKLIETLIETKGKKINSKLQN